MLNIIEYSYSDELTANTLIIHKLEKEYGISLIKNKYIHRKKARDYIHLFFTDEVFKSFLMAVKNKESDVYFSCRCYSEVLRIMYDEELDKSYILIYDNYYLKCPKFVAQEIYLSCNELMVSSTRFVEDLESSKQDVKKRGDYT